MSTNRKRKSGMRRAYLKRTSYKHDSNPDSAMKDAIGLGRNINPIVATPHRARLWLDKNKHTPTLTEPMSAKLMQHNPEHFGLKPKPDTWHTIKCVNTPLLKIEMLFNGFTERSIYYFRMEDKLTNTVRESFTMMQAAAYKIKAAGLKKIPWKENSDG
jgi:hypothetical protein